MEKFIKGTNKRYSITDKGEVYSNYFYICGKKRYRRDKMTVAWNSKKDCVKVRMTYKLNTPAVLKSIYVLMRESFDLRPPDIYHRYNLSPKDGNYLNPSLDNLYFKLITGKHDYEVKTFHDANGNLTHKTCGKCGEKKEIENFAFMSAQYNGKINPTYSNTCNPCKHKRTLVRVKADPELFKRYRQVQKQGNKRQSKNRLAWMNKKREELHDTYVKSTITLRSDLTAKDLTPELIELKRKQLKLHRHVKKSKDLQSQ